MERQQSEEIARLEFEALEVCSEYHVPSRRAIVALHLYHRAVQRRPSLEAVDKLEDAPVSRRHRNSLRGSQFQRTPQVRIP